MNYKQAIQYIENLSLLDKKRPSLPSLKRITAFLSNYDSPQNSYTSFHIAGTNGKGSTTAMLDSILRRGKLKIGRFTGPHILRFNERFHINGQPITDAELAKGIGNLKEMSEQFASQQPVLGALTSFEFLTALSFLYFAQSGVDVAVIEVGLGGRFDATNVLNKLYATGITNIDLDHQNILGSTLEEIAMEKAGIIKAHVPIVTAASEPALSVIVLRASELKAPLTNSSEGVLEKSKSKTNTQLLQELRTIKANLCQRGIYQYQNALTALCLLSESGLLDSDTAVGADQNIIANKISINDAVVGLQHFYWPGRFQLVESQQIIMDGAHNPAGIKVLRESLDHLFPKQKFHFIFACYNDKGGLNMLENLLRIGDKLYLVDISDKKLSFDLSVLEKFAQEHKIIVNSYATISEAFTAAKSNRKTDEFIVATGSFATVRALLLMLGWKAVEDGIN